jgi:surface protein
MAFLFYFEGRFNADISGWVTSKVTTIYGMFDHATAFNQPIDNWDVSKVTSMWYMFNLAFAFNQPIGSWDVAKVTNMRSMFYAAFAFNQPISNWDVSKVTDMDYCSTTPLTSPRTSPPGASRISQSLLTSMRAPTSPRFSFPSGTSRWRVAPSSNQQV